MIEISYGSQYHSSEGLLDFRARHNLRSLFYSDKCRMTRRTRGGTIHFSASEHSYAFHIASRYPRRCKWAVVIFLVEVDDNLPIDDSLCLRGDGQAI